MKFIIFSLFTLVGCQKKISCGFLEAPIKLAASKISEVGECNPLIIENELKEALVKIKVCQEDIGIAGLNASPIICNLAPAIVNILGDQLGSRASCKKVGVIGADLIKKALNCEQ